MYIKPEETYEITLLFQLITRQFQDISNFSARRLKRGRKNSTVSDKHFGSGCFSYENDQKYHLPKKRTEPWLCWSLHLYTGICNFVKTVCLNFHFPWNWSTTFILISNFRNWKVWKWDYLLKTESKSNERSLKLIQMLKSWEGSLSERSPDLLSWAEKQV